METQIDFLRWLEPDMALKILKCLDDSTDLIRASAVSRHWQNIVVSNGLSKRLCVTRFPELAYITDVVRVNRGYPEPNHSVVEREHRAYASLFRALTTFPQVYCNIEPVSASSTDKYPEESIRNTLDPRDRIMNMRLHWSSKGSDDPEKPEKLIYSLTSNLWVITEINLQPFQAYFQEDSPIYASKFVRFRMGHPKCWKGLNRRFMDAQECADDKFNWTYTSQIFPVEQENCLQRFELPNPVVCIGGFMQIELLGRVQEQAADGKYYICVTHVQVIGRKLSPSFCIEFSEPFDIVHLKYDPLEFGMIMSYFSAAHYSSSSTSLLPVQLPRQLARRRLQKFRHMVQAHINRVEHEWENDEF